jgi:hypothetical protein
LRFWGKPDPYYKPHPFLKKRTNHPWTFCPPPPPPQILLAKLRLLLAGNASEDGGGDTPLFTANTAVHIVKFASH